MSIVERAQSKLSESSIQYIQSESSKILTATCPEARFVEEMLRDQHIKDIHEGENRLLNALFKCFFYNLKVILLRAQEKQTLILIKKKIKKNEEPIRLFFRSKVSGEAFQPLNEVETSNLQQDEPTFVIEGFMPHSIKKEALENFIKAQGLFEIIMADVAQEPQYTGKFKESPVNNAKAQEEIAHYAKKALEIGCHKDNPKLFLIDHTYSNSVKAELKI